MKSLLDIPTTYADMTWTLKFSNCSSVNSLRKKRYCFLLLHSDSHESIMLFCSLWPWISTIGWQHCRGNSSSEHQPNQQAIHCSRTIMSREVEATNFSCFKGLSVLVVVFFFGKNVNGCNLLQLASFPPLAPIVCISCHMSKYIPNSICTTHMINPSKIYDQRKHSSHLCVSVAIPLSCWEEDV